MTTQRARITFFIVFLSISLYSTELGDCAGLIENFTWTKLSYKPIVRKTTRSSSDDQKLVFPKEVDVEEAIPVHFIEDPFVYEKNIPIGANRWKNRLFITVPRRQFGIPSTLNYVNYDSVRRHDLPLIPYPDFPTNTLASLPGKENFVSIYRITVDPCDRLWMVDTGIIEMPGNRTVLKKQRLIIMDLNTDRIIKTYRFKNEDLTPKTTLTMIAVDVTNTTCDDAYAYFPDLAGFGLVVYSLKSDNSWRIQHEFFKTEPEANDLNIAGNVFRWNDGIFSIALTGMNADGYRTALFHSLMGSNLYKVSTRIFKNPDLANANSEGDFEVLGSKGEDSHSSASDLHKKSGILFFGLVNQNAVGCWNTNKPFQTSNIGIVHRDDTKMIYPSDVKVYEDDLIVLTNAMPVFVYSKLNYKETNFRVWTANVYEAVKGTVCE